MEGINRCQVCQWGALRDAAREVEETFEDTVFQLDEASLAKTWKMAEASWFLPRWIKQRRVYKVFKLASRTPKAYKKERTPESLAVLHEFWDKEGLVQERQGEWRQLFGDAWKDGRPGWKSLEAMFDTAPDLQELAVQIEPDQGGHTLLQRTAERALQNLDVFRRQTGGCILELTGAFGFILLRWRNNCQMKQGIDFKQLHQQGRMLGFPLLLRWRSVGRAALAVSVIGAAGIALAGRAAEDWTRRCGGRHRTLASCKPAQPWNLFIKAFT
ncbi:MAG: hypothetical protein ACLR23_13700 [Clostridia bacterium]